MKRRREQFLLKLGALLVLTGSAAASYVLIGTRHQLPAAATQTKSPKVKPTIAFPSQKDLSVALSGRFFSDPPKPVVPAKSPPKKRTIRWPAVEVNSVMIGQRSRIVVLKSGQQSFTCREGDKFLEVLVSKINETEVLLKYKGDNKTIRNDRQTKGRNDQLDSLRRIYGSEVENL